MIGLVLRLGLIQGIQRVGLVLMVGLRRVSGWRMTGLIHGLGLVL